MRVIIPGRRHLLLAIDEILVVIEIAVVGGNAVVAAEILGPGHLLAGQQGLVELFAVPGADDLDLVVGPEQLPHRQGEIADGRGRRLLDEGVALPAVAIGVEDQIDRIVDRHQEPGHVRVGDSQRFPFPDQLDEQRDDRPPRGHDVAVAGAAEGGPGRIDEAGLGHHQLLHHGLRDPHGVDGIDRLVGAEADHLLDPAGRRRIEDVFRPQHIGLHCLQRVELAGRDLLQRRRLKDIIDALHGRHDAGRVTHIADIKFQLGIGEIDAHILLLLLIPAEDPDLFDIGSEEAIEDGIAEGAGAAGDEEGFAAEH